jgi:glycosyltransferase involved in cell wall biosynthesis
MVDVSIITPTLGADQEQLIRCVNSVEKQKGIITIEHVLIVPENTDLKFLPQPKNFTRRIVTEDMPGVYGAFNLGLEIARGENICFLGDDDFLDPDALYDRLNHLKSTCSDAIYTDVSNPIQDRFHPSALAEFDVHHWSRNLLPIQHASFLFRTELFSSFGRFKHRIGPVKLHICSDYEWLSRIISHERKISYLSKATVYVGRSGISNRRSFRIQFEGLAIAVIRTEGIGLKIKVIRIWLARFFLRVRDKGKHVAKFD